MGAGASTDVDVKSIPEVQAANARLEALEAQVARLTEALQQANAANGSPAAAGGAGPAGASGAGSGEASESKSEMGWFDVGEASGFEEGTMAEVSVPAEGATDPTPVLLVREKGTGAFHAVGGRCTHYGAPLAKGVLSGCRVTCPWHSACFDASTGDVEDGCALDALPTYDARVSEAGVVQIHARRKATDRAARRAPTVKPGAVGASSGAIDGPGMLIVGSGPAGLTAAQTLREEGWQGKITMVTAEDRLPYDRVQLSKRLSGSPRLLRPASFFQEHEIDVRLGERVVAVDSAARTVSLKSGATLPYGKLLCATGSFARRCTEEQAPLSGGFFLPGADLPGVFAVRVADDAARITAALDEAAAARDGGARVVIVGASFVGMEVAATIAASGKAESVTVMDINAQPYERVLGAEIGACIRRLHGEESGGVVKFLMPAKVTSFAPAEGDAGGRVAVVNVEGSDAVPCDFVVLGCGALPEVDYLTKTAGVELNAPATGGGVVVDDKLKAADVRCEHLSAPLCMLRVVADTFSLCVPLFWTSSTCTPPETSRRSPTGRLRARWRAWSTGTWRRSRVASPRATCSARRSSTAPCPSSGRSSSRSSCATRATRPCGTSRSSSTARRAATAAGWPTSCATASSPRSSRSTKTLSRCVAQRAFAQPPRRRSPVTRCAHPGGRGGAVPAGGHAHGGGAARGQRRPRCVGARGVVRGPQAIAGSTWELNFRFHLCLRFVDLGAPPQGTHNAHHGSARTVACA